MNNNGNVSKSIPYNLDFRITKTHKYLSNALFSLLEKKSFNKITVKEICDTALVSRSSFYSSFEDKYHLLLFCLEELKAEVQDQVDYNNKTLMLDYALSYIESHGKLFKSLFNTETTLELRNMLISVFHEELAAFLQVKQTINQEEFPYSIDLMAIFAAGGTTQLIQWWVCNDFSVPKEKLLRLLDNFP